MTSPSDLRENLRKQISLSNLSCSDHLYGRSSEESILENSYYAALTMRANSPANIVLINGESGMGKTRLGEQLCSYAKEDDGFFIRGKFDQSSYDTAALPYSGITNAFREFCAKLEQREDDREGIVKALNRELDPSEGTLLCDAFPPLKRLVPYNEEETSSDPSTFINDSSRSSQNRSYRLNYVLEKFMSTVTTSVNDPIVFLMDDMQWSDASSLALIKTMASAAKSPFIFVFTFRPLARDNPFIQMIDKLGKRNNVAEISLRGLSANGVHELVCGVLGLDSESERCGQLSTFLCRLTKGNPLFVRQHIISLFDKGLIRFDDNELVWDLNIIEKSGALSRSLDSMTLDEIKRLPESAQLALQVCACIGSMISFEVLGILMMRLCNEKECPYDSETNPTSIGKNMVSLAIEDGLLVEIEGGVSFVHDSVQSAAYSLLEVGHQERFHCTLAQILRSELPDDLDKWSSNNLFTVANQYARGHTNIEEYERIEPMNSVVRILLLATEESRMIADFRGAHYFYIVLDYLLYSSDWTRHYRLCCTMYIHGAENALWADHYYTDRWLNYLAQYIKGSKIDEIRALWVRVNWLATTRKGEEAIDQGLKELKRLAGIKISKHVKFGTMVALVKTRRLLKGHTASTLLQCPRMTYIHMSVALKILNLIAILCVGNRTKMTGLVCLKLVELNMTHGISSTMPVALAWYGITLKYRGLITESLHYSEMALRLQDELNCNETKAQVAALCYGSIHTSTNKLSECIKPLHDAHIDGLRAGDVRYSMICAHFLCTFTLHSGAQLAVVSDTLVKYSRLMREYSTPYMLKVNMIYEQAVTLLRRHLRPSRRNSFALRSIMPQNSTMLEKEHAYSSQAMTAYILDDYSTAWASSQDFCRISNIRQAFLALSTSCFRCMAALALLQSEKSKKLRFSYRKAINSDMKSVRSMAKKSPPHYDSLLHLIEAEYAIVCQKKFEVAERLFSSSIQKFTLTGQTHYEALAWERFGLYHIKRGNHDVGYEKLRKAHKLYGDWGANLKCDLMVRKNKDLFA